MQSRPPRALISVTNKAELDFLGPALITLGFELVSTGGTAQKLRSMGLSVTDVEEVTAFPEMMDGRLKTLHPNIFGGILARPNHDGDREALASHGIGLFDVVVVNLYEFEKHAADKTLSFDALVEHIDIGGPSLIRAAAKNWRRVYVVVDPSQYKDVVNVLRDYDADSDEAMSYRQALATAAFETTTEYDDAIYGVFNDCSFKDGTVKRS